MRKSKSNRNYAMTKKRLQPDDRKEQILKAAIKVAAKPGGWSKLTREAVAKLKTGQYTPIIALTNPQTKQVAGFQIVKLIAVEPAGQREISDPRVEQQIRSQLQDRREQLMKAAYYEVMHDQAKIENYYAQRLLQK